MTSVFARKVRQGRQQSLAQYVSDQARQHVSVAGSVLQPPGVEVLLARVPAVHPLLKGLSEQAP